jgi:hypothetical protein
LFVDQLYHPTSSLQSPTNELNHFNHKLNATITSQTKTSLVLNHSIGGGADVCLAPGSYSRMCTVDHIRHIIILQNCIIFKKIKLCFAVTGENLSVI